MKVVCAWCRDQGRPGLLGVREPLEDLSITHGICPEHYEEMLTTLPAPSSPGLAALIVVNRGGDSLYRYLTDSLAGVKGVKVIMERRMGERRQERRSVTYERRHVERRARRGRVFAMGYRVIRFAG